MALYHESDTGWAQQTGPASKTSTSFNASAGLLVVMASSEVNTTVANLTPSNNGTALTWTQRFLSSGPHPGLVVWTAHLPESRTGFTVTVSLASGFTDEWGFQVWAFSNQQFGSFAEGYIDSGLPTVNLTTVAASSDVVAMFVDFTGSDNGTVTYSTINGGSATQDLNLRVAGIINVYGARWTNVGTAGSKTVAVNSASLDSNWVWRVGALEARSGMPATPAVGLVTETDTAQPQQTTKKAREIGLATETDQARPSKWLVEVGQAVETSSADRVVVIGDVSVTPDLGTVWMNVASNSQDHMSFPNMASLTVSKVKPGDIRRMVGGKDRLFLREGSQRAVTANLPGCTRGQVEWLEDHVGVLLCVRDDRGRKLFAVYAEVVVDEYSVTTAFADCSVALGEVTHSEVV